MLTALSLIDFGVGDVIVPKQEKRSIPTQLDGFQAPEVSAYSIETTVAEKLDAILSLMEYSSRMKDYYDIFYLANKFDFDGDILSRAMTETFSNRDREFTVQQFDQLLSLDIDAAMKRKWLAFLKKVKRAEPDFADVLKTLSDFLHDILASVVSGQEFKKFWKASDGCWIGEF